MNFRVSILAIFFGFVLLNGLIFGVAHVSGGMSIMNGIGRGGIVMLQLIGMASFFFLAAAIGAWLIRMLRTEIVPESLCWGYALGLGLIVYSLGTSVLALMQQAKPLPAFIMLVGLTIFSRSEGIFLWKKACCLRWVFPTSWRDRLYSLGWGFGFVLLELAFISSAANILSADFDSFHQYLTFPMEYFQQGGFTVFEWHPSFGFPQFGEMLLLLSIILFGVVGPFYLNLFLVLVLVTLVYLAFRHFGVSLMARSVYTACLVTSPTLYALGSGIVKIEPVYFLYIVLTLVLAREILIRDPCTALNNDRTRVLLGLFIGTLLSIKYTAFFIVAAFWIAFWLIAERKWSLFGHAMHVMAIAFVLFSPWLIKNWAVYDSLLYPIFPGQDQFFLETGKSLVAGFRDGAQHDMILQFSSVIHASGDIVFDNLQIFFVSIFKFSPIGLFPGIWTVAVLILSSFVAAHFRTLDRYGKFLIYFSFLFAIGWSGFFLGAMWYLYPVWFSLLFLIATNPLPDRAERWVLGCFAIAAILSGLVLGFSTTQQTRLSIAFANGDTTFRQAVENNWGSTANIDAYARLNTLLAEEPEAKVYSFQDPRGYFIDRSSRRFVLDYYGEKFLTLGTPAEVRATLRSIGVRYILGSRSREADCGRSESVENPICAALSQFLKFTESESLPILFNDGGVTIYKL